MSSDNAGHQQQPARAALPRRNQRAETGAMSVARLQLTYITPGCQLVDCAERPGSPLIEVHLNLDTRASPDTQA